MATNSRRRSGARGGRSRVALGLAFLVASFAGPLAPGVTASDASSSGQRHAITVSRIGDAIGFGGRPGAPARVQSAIRSDRLSTELAAEIEHERPSSGSSSGQPGGPPILHGAHVTSATPGLLGFAGLTHFDQRFADGGNQFSTEPPDGAVCAGHGKVIEMVNTALAVYDQTGAPVAGPVGINEFFGFAPSIDRTAHVYGPFMGDVKCLFDPGTQRWFISSLNLTQDPLTGDFTGQTAVDWAVSKSSDPTGDYTVFEIDTTNGDGTASGHAGCPCLGDQPLIGVDGNGFYISTNEFSFFGPEFNGAQVYAMNKAGLAEAAIGGSIPAAVQFDQIKLAEGDAYSLQPASPATAGQFDARNHGTAYFLSALDFNGTTDNRIALWGMTNTSSLSGAHPAPRLQSKVISSEAYALPPAAHQKSGSTPLRDALRLGLLGDPVRNPLSKLDGGDDRMSTAALSTGLVWGSLATAVKFDGEGRAHVGAAWFAVRPSWNEGRLRARMVTQGYVAVGGSDVIYPGLSLNAAGKGALAFTLTGTGRHPSAAYVSLSRSGIGDVHIAAAGAGPEDGFSGYRLAPTDPAPRPRWGDYTGTAVDEIGRIWFEAEYIGQTCTVDEFAADTTCGGTRSTLANWATWVGRLTP